MSTDRSKDIKFLNKSFLYKYYQNSRNGIEDPIFTGFTLDIDTIHSPLFYTDYDTDEILRGNGKTELAQQIEERLMKINNINITGNPDTYELNTLSSKDPIADRMAGYGLQNKFYLDNILYGATDYIYMVDKETQSAFSDNLGVGDIGNGTPNSSVLQQYGDVLDRDPDLTIEAQNVQNQVNEATSSIRKINIFFDLDQSIIRSDQRSSVDTLIDVMKNNPDCTVNLNGYADKDTGRAPYNMTLSGERCDSVERELINAGISASRISKTSYGDTVQPFYKELNRAVACEIDGDVSQKSALALKIVNESSMTISIKDGDDKEQNSILNEHDTHIQNLSDAKEKYEKLKKEYDDIEKNIKDLENQFSEQKYNVKVEYEEYCTTMKDAVNKLSTLPDDSEEKQKTATLIDETYNKFIELKDNKNNQDKYPNIEMQINSDNDVSNFQSEESGLSESDKQKFINFYRHAWEVMKSTASTPVIKNDANKDLNTLKAKKEELTNKLFGTHDDKTIGSEQNPTETSLYGEYLKAKDESDNDTYSIQQRKVAVLNDINDNYENVKEYQEYQATKTNQIVKNLPSIDYKMTEAEMEDPTAYANRIREKRNIRQTYEVPQTVYDMLGFIDGMKKLTYEYPYALQTVTGLDEAYKKYFDLTDPYMGSGEGKITISCLEYLDMRISSMFNKYFNAIYDHQYKRERVPVNLRRFQCSIFVHDIRNFKDSIKGDIERSMGDLSNIVQVALNSLSVIEFKFYDCEIVPEETGSIFENVTNLPANDMRNTNFTFKYGNCVINFLPFEDLRKYLLGKSVEEIKPNPNYISLEEQNTQKYQNNSLWKSNNLPGDTNNPDGNFRRWFDKSPLGNVNNNDYRDYVRRDSTVAVDDHFKTTIVNDFAMNSVVQKNKQLTEMDDALRRLVVGISASTGIPTKGVPDALNIKQIDPILNDDVDLAAAVIKELGNVNNSRIIDTDTTEYIGTAVTEDDKNTSADIVTDLGNVNEEKGGE